EPSGPRLWSANHRPRGFSCLRDVGETDAVILSPDGLQPVTDITPKNERIRGSIPTLLLVGDEGREWNGGQIHLFGRHFRKLRYRDLHCVRYPIEIGLVGRFVPVEEMRVVDKVLHHEIFPITKIIGGSCDLIQRGDGGSEDVENDEGDLTLVRCLDEADVAQRVERR